MFAGAGAVYAIRTYARKKREISFLNKTVLITGGSRGLGLVLAREFAAAGARVALCAREAEELDRAQSDLKKRGAQVFTIECDVTDEADVNRMAQTVKEKFGPVDILINNAGIIQVGPMETMTREDYQEAMNTHFWGAMNTVNACLPQMKARGGGRIVNISSIGGKVSVPHMLPYSASKFALVGYSEGLRAELLKDNILVTTVCPGLTRTGSHLNATFKGEHRAEYTLFSVLGALPFSSTDALTTAQKIMSACKYGEAELIISPQAIAIARFHALFPDLFCDLMGMMNKALPKAGGIGTRSALGKDSQSSLSPSILTSSIEIAAAHNHEVN